MIPRRATIDSIETLQSEPDLGPLHMSPVDRAGSVTGMNFALGSYEKFQPKILRLREFWRQIWETKQTWRKTKILTFGPILPSVTLKTVSLQLNGMLMMWKIQQAMQDDSIRAARIHPGNRDEVFIWHTEPAPPPALSYEHIENFTKDLEVRRDLGNRASPVNGAYEVLRASSYEPG